MKVIIVLFSLICTSMLWGQNIPESVSQDFNKRFNHNDEALNVQWESDQSGYSVTYVMNFKKGIVYYDDQGTFKESRVYVQFDEIEQGAQTYVNDNYPDAKVVNCYRLNTDTAPERSTVEIESSGKTIKLFFRPDGKFHYKQ